MACLNMRMNKEETDTGNKGTGRNLREGPTVNEIPVTTRKWITIATGLRTEAKAWPDMMKTVDAQGRDRNLRMNGQAVTEAGKCPVMANADMAHLSDQIMEEKVVNIRVAMRDMEDKAAGSIQISMTNADTVQVSVIQTTSGHQVEIRTVTGMKMSGDSAAIAEIWDQTGAAGNIWTIITVTGDPEISVPVKGKEEDGHGMMTATRDTAVD